LIEIINKQLLLQLVGYLCYWQMGFNSVFKGLSWLIAKTKIILTELYVFLSFFFLFLWKELKQVNLRIFLNHTLYK